MCHSREDIFDLRKTIHSYFYSKFLIFHFSKIATEHVCGVRGRVGWPPPRGPLRGLHQPYPPRRLRGRADPALQLGGASLGVPAHDELQRAKPWLRLRQVWLQRCNDERHPSSPWLRPGAWLQTECLPQQREETPVHQRSAAHHQAHGVTPGTISLILYPRKTANRFARRCTSPFL